MNLHVYIIPGNLRLLWMNLHNVQVNVFININYFSTQVSCCYINVHVLSSLSGFQGTYQKVGLPVLIRYTCTDSALKVEIQNIYVLL